LLPIGIDNWNCRRVLYHDHPMGRPPNGHTTQRLMAIYVREPTNEQVFVYNLLNHISGISYYISAVANPILYR